jgi:hypothetical protein
MIEHLGKRVAFSSITNPTSNRNSNVLLGSAFDRTVHVMPFGPILQMMISVLPQADKATKMVSWFIGSLPVETSINDLDCGNDGRMASGLRIVLISPVSIFQTAILRLGFPKIQ